MEKLVSKRKIYTVLAIVAIFITALLLRIKSFSGDGLWFDELYSVWVASESFPKGILERLYTDDAHAPLYHFILHFYIKFFGNSDIGFQIFNTIISMLAFPVVYLLGYEVAGGKNNENSYKFGLLSMLLLTFNYSHIAHSSQTRFYNLSGLFFTLSTLFLFKQVNSGAKKRYAALVILFNTLLCYTLTQGSLYVFIQAIVFGVYFLIHKRELIKPLIISSFATFLLYIPYLPFVFHQFESSRNSFFGPYTAIITSPMRLLRVFNDLFAINPVTQIRIRDVGNLTTLHNWNILLFFIIEIALFATFLVKSFKLKDSGKKAIFFLLFLLCTLHLAFAAFHIAPFAPRILIPLIPIFSVCYASVLMAFKTKWLRAIIICSLVIPGVFLIVLNKKPVTLENYYGFGQLINKLNSYNLTPDDRIYMSSGAELLPTKGINVTPIDINHNATFLFYNPKRLEAVFGDDYLKYNAPGKREEYLNKYVFSSKINIHNRNYYNKQIEKMPKGARFILWLEGGGDVGYKFLVEDYEYYNGDKKQQEEFIKELGESSGGMDYYYFAGSKIDADYEKLASQDKRLKMVEEEFLGQGIVGIIHIYKKIKD